MESNKKPTEKEEASNKEVTSSKQTLEKLKEKSDQEKPEEGEKQPQISRKGKEAMEEPAKEQRQGVKTFTPPLPYPQRFNKETKVQYFPKFLEVFKKLEINIPLAEALEQMPLYAKFLKELINKKRSWHEKETILLNEECSALIQKGLPPKLEDLRSFFLPCTIGNISINLIPSSLMKRLCIEEVKPIQMSLELVDKFVVFPKGVIENLLLKVDKFIFHAYFVILDLDEE
ncbi:uncharacterized protein LOC130949587 [Arachis stenosperma]|uniref:uncharacterized protein LOC130949587 n=1 Tax=Arachis stenosperma TaxID=217475 RepID=UPI0025AD3010|nr:uncharacterized protein LOC130949587 [Arachis stenosperma]